jgi:uncharacterized protein YbcI
MQADNQTSGTSPSAEISTSAVQILRKYTGRGPVKARTHITGDLVSIVMGDTLTTAEQTLVAAGHWGKVEAARLELQNAMEHDLSATVEQHTGRKVAAFLSSNHRDPDLAVENFVLAPE